MTWGPRHPSSKPFLKKVKRNLGDLHLLLLLLLFLFPCPAPSCVCVSANTGAWIVEKPPVQLSSAQRSLGNGLSLCNKKIFFSFLKFFITFSLRVCEKVPRSDWNCSTIEITEHKQTDKRKKKEWTILFISIFERKKCLHGTVFLFKVPSTSKVKSNFVKTWNQKST